MEQISIIIPVIREESARRCIEAIKKNAGIPSEDYEIIAKSDTSGIGCPKMVKALTKIANYDLVMFLGDDTIPEKDFLKHAIEAMETLPDGWGVVGLNTQDIRSTDGNPLAHWMAHKKMLKHIEGGNFFSTDYAHCWCDNELKDIADEMGRWVYAKDSLITHNHPVNGTAENDKGYKKAYSKENENHDVKTYYKRKRARMVKKHGVKLAISVPLTDDKVYNQFLFSFVKVVTEYMASLANAGKQINCDVLFPDFPGQIDAVRNNLVQQALNLGSTHILMMDSDQIYNTDNMIEKMLAHDKLVLSCKVHRRYPPFDTLLMEGEVGKLSPIPDERIRDKDGNYETELQVEYTGTGCIMYDTSIFINMFPEKAFEFKTGEHGQPIGEDIGFCDKLKKMGIPIIADCSIDIKHLTLLAVDFGTHLLFKKIMGIKNNN